MSWARMNEILGYNDTSLLNTHEYELYYQPSDGSDDDPLTYSDEEEYSSGQREEKKDRASTFNARELLRMIGIDDSTKDHIGVEISNVGRTKTPERSISFYKPITPRTREKRINFKKLSRTISTRMEKVSPRMMVSEGEEESKNVEYDNLAIEEIVSKLEEIGPSEVNFDDLVGITKTIEARIKTKFPDMDEKTLIDMDILGTLDKYVRDYRKEQGYSTWSFYLSS